MLSKKLKVLVIEDNPGDLRLLNEALKPYIKNQFDLICENCLRDGLERISGDKIDLILLDLFLPESSGLQTLEKIKEAAPRIPIIVMSGIYTDWLAIHALRLGAFCVLKKDWLDGKNLARAFRYYADLVPAD